RSLLFILCQVVTILTGISTGEETSTSHECDRIASSVECRRQAKIRGSPLSPKLCLFAVLHCRSSFPLALLKDGRKIIYKGCFSPLHGQLWDAERSARTLRDRFAFHRVPQPTAHDIECLRVPPDSWRLSN
ncbi:hypothetical protein IFM46972_05306, partial [Aspergillus udagawae]